MNILFVCTGNTCRSPMAMALARHIFDRLETPENYNIKSAGSCAFGKAASLNAIKTVAEIDLSLGEMLKKYKSQNITVDLINWADMIFVMDKNHALAVLQLFHDVSDEELKNAKNKITILNVPDPFGGNLDLYKKTRDWLVELIEEIIRDINKD